MTGRLCRLDSSWLRLIDVVDDMVCFIVVLILTKSLSSVARLVGRRVVVEGSTADGRD